MVHVKPFVQGLVKGRRYVFPDEAACAVVKDRNEELADLCHRLGSFPSLTFLMRNVAAITEFSSKGFCEDSAD